MSIAHLGLAGDTRGSSETRHGDRTPPHDLLAEQSAIGGMLLSKDAVADVVETVRGVDFYIPKHEIIFDAVLGLYSHGEPTDVIAVTDELTKSGELTRAGGAEYLHTLTGLVPTAANAGVYASIVAQKAVNMKSTIFTGLTGTPTLRAALASPPEAKIQFPRRVRVRMTCAITARPRAQRMTAGTPFTAGLPSASLSTMPILENQTKSDWKAMPEKSEGMMLSPAASLTPDTIVRLENRIESAMVRPRRI